MVDKHYIIILLFSFCKIFYILKVLLEIATECIPWGTMNKKCSAENQKQGRGGLCVREQSIFFFFLDKHQTAFCITSRHQMSLAGQRSDAAWSSSK